MRPRVKICGLRRVEDAELALALGAHALGCVLAADSPRRATRAQARALAAFARDRAPLVLVFRGERSEEVRAACAQTGTRDVQLHGAPQEEIAALEQEGLRCWRVYPLDAEALALPALDPPPDARCPALLDCGRGGSGRAFDWSLLGERGPEFTYVAGGITPENVGALLAHRPWGIDCSSGVERSPGEKDPERLRALFRALEAVA